MSLTLLILGALLFLLYRHITAHRRSTLYIRDDQVTQMDASPSAAVAILASASAAAVTNPPLRVPILMYHYVEHVQNKRDTLRQKLDVAPEVLDAQIKDLQQNGYTFIWSSDISTALDENIPLPSKPILLTFDDGYRDFYTDVLPILERNNAKATAYIISGFIGEPNYMFLPQLQEVVQSGLVEIGAHTIHHINLQLATDKEAQEEIAQSKTDLEKLLNVKVKTFAYPGGRFNEHTIQIVKDAGFTNAVSTIPGTEISTENRFILFRLRPGARTNKSLIEFLETELKKNP